MLPSFMAQPIGQFRFKDDTQQELTTHYEVISANISSMTCNYITSVFCSGSSLRTIKVFVPCSAPLGEFLRSVACFLPLSLWDLWLLWVLNPGNVATTVAILTLQPKYRD